MAEVLNLATFWSDPVLNEIYTPQVYGGSCINTMVGGSFRK